MKLRIATWAALIAVIPTAASSAMARPAAEAHARTVPLTISTATGIRHLKVEVATSPAEQERGLMFRRLLPKHGGMIFPMDPPRLASFWMKNTLIPLDLIFIRANGTIVRIAHGKPLALDLIESGEPVAGVLEIGGGRAAAMGIHADDRVTWQGADVAPRAVAPPR